MILLLCFLIIFIALKVDLKKRALSIKTRSVLSMAGNVFFTLSMCLTILSFITHIHLIYEREEITRAVSLHREQVSISVYEYNKNIELFHNVSYISCIYDVIWFLHDSETYSHMYINTNR